MDTAEPTPFDDSETMEHLWARTSARIGMIAMGLCMAAQCTCTASYWLALPLSAVGIIFAWRAFQGAPAQSATRAYAKIGLIANVTSLAFCAVYFVVVAAYTALWIGIVVLDA